MEIGIHTFGELVPDPYTHQKISAHHRLKQVIQMAILADEVGLDIFGFGEHHRLDIAASAPPVVLAAVAQATKRIRLTSTATVLSDETESLVRVEPLHRASRHAKLLLRCRRRRRLHRGQ